MFARVGGMVDVFTSRGKSFDVSLLTPRPAAVRGTSISGSLLNSGRKSKP